MASWSTTCSSCPASTPERSASPCRPMPLSDVVSETIAGARAGRPTRNVSVGGNVDPEAKVRADPGALSRVVGNLVMNAIRHTPADGMVGVQGRRDGAVVELSVTDGCGGISAADLDRCSTWGGG